jgi:hypothetical protein
MSMLCLRMNGSIFRALLWEFWYAVSIQSLRGEHPVIQRVGFEKLIERAPWATFIGTVRMFHEFADAFARLAIPDRKRERSGSHCYPFARAMNSGATCEAPRRSAQFSKQFGYPRSVEIRHGISQGPRSEMTTPKAHLGRIVSLTQVRAASRGLIRPRTLAWSTERWVVSLVGIEMSDSNAARQSNRDREKTS